MFQSDQIEHAVDRDRLLLRGQELHAGDSLELQVRGAWVPARVEWSPSLGWYALARRAKNDHRELTVILRPGLVARHGLDRSEER